MGRLFKNPLGIDTLPLSEAEHILASLYPASLYPVLSQTTIFNIQGVLLSLGLWLSIRVLRARGLSLYASNIQACEPGSLTLPNPPQDDAGEAVPNFTPLSKLDLAKVSIDPEHCLPYKGPECGACAHTCPVPGALIWDMTRPQINPNKCVGCALCREACIVEPKAIRVQTVQ